MTTEEKLMAYADGELVGQHHASMKAALPANEELRRALTQERLLRCKLSDVYDPALDEEVPERFTRLIHGGTGTSGFGQRKSEPTSAWWQNVTAIAATLVVGIFVGQSLNGSDNLLTAPDAQAVDGQVKQALDNQLASAQTIDSPVQVGISFVGPEGKHCRTFETSAVAGLACRSESQWRVMLLAPESSSSRFEYEQAGSGSALVMRSAQEFMVGDPMDAVQERQARDLGWRPVTPQPRK